MRTTTVVIGAGHAGLAVSRRLTERSIDHVVLERGAVANSWRTERWPSLRLLTPNWQTTLPDLADHNHDPHGFMPVADVVDLITGYAASISAPVQTATTVTAVGAHRDRYLVQTDRGMWQARTVVLATGACNLPAVPAVARQVPVSITNLTPMSYRGPNAIPDGGVLVVGASATGVQLALEIHRSGRPVTLSVGEHVRLPRNYRGRDVFWWMQAAGLLDEGPDQIDDLTRARHVPSPQLFGSPEHRFFDLNLLSESGVRIVGRLGTIVEGVAQFSGGLANVCTLADLKLNRLLARFDTWAAEASFDSEVGPPERFESTHIDPQPTLALDLSRAEIRSIIWATGYRPDYSWLDLPILDRAGHIRHDGGVIHDAPGLYLLGTPFLRRRASTYISGAAADSLAISAHLHTRLDTTVRRCASSRSNSESL